MSRSGPATSGASPASRSAASYRSRASAGAASAPSPTSASASAVRSFPSCASARASRERPGDVALPGDAPRPGEAEQRARGERGVAGVAGERRGLREGALRARRGSPAARSAMPLAAGGVGGEPRPVHRRGVARGAPVERRRGARVVVAARRLPRRPLAHRELLRAGAALVPAPREDEQPERGGRAAASAGLARAHGRPSACAASAGRSSTAGGTGGPGSGIDPRRSQWLETRSSAWFDCMTRSCTSPTSASNSFVRPRASCASWSARSATLVVAATSESIFPQLRCTSSRSAAVRSYIAASVKSLPGAPLAVAQPAQELLEPRERPGRVRDRALALHRDGEPVERADELVHVLGGAGALDLAEDRVGLLEDRLGPIEDLRHLLAHAVDRLARLHGRIALRLSRHQPPLGPGRGRAPGIERDGEIADEPRDGDAQLRARVGAQRLARGRADVEAGADDVPLARRAPDLPHEVAREPDRDADAAAPPRASPGR